MLSVGVVCAVRKGFVVELQQIKIALAAARATPPKLGGSQLPHEVSNQVFI